MTNAFVIELQKSTKALIEKHFDTSILKLYGPGGLSPSTITLTLSEFDSIKIDFSVVRSNHIRIYYSHMALSYTKPIELVEISNPEFEKDIIFAIAKTIIDKCGEHKQILRQELEGLNKIITQSYGAIRETNWKKK